MALTSTEQQPTASTPTDAEPPLVDSHFHLFPLGLPYTATAHARPDYSLTAEEHLATMDAYGVQFGVVAAMSLTGYYNDYVVESLRARVPASALYVGARVQHDERVHEAIKLAADRGVPVRLLGPQRGEHNGRH